MNKSDQRPMLSSIPRSSQKTKLCYQSLLHSKFVYPNPQNSTCPIKIHLRLASFKYIIKQKKIPQNIKTDKNITFYTSFNFFKNLCSFLKNMLTYVAASSWVEPDRVRILPGLKIPLLLPPSLIVRCLLEDPNLGISITGKIKPPFFEWCRAQL